MPRTRSFSRRPNDARRRATRPGRPRRHPLAARRRLRLSATGSASASASSSCCRRPPRGALATAVAPRLRRERLAHVARRVPAVVARPARRFFAALEHGAAAAHPSAAAVGPPNPPDPPDPPPPPPPRRLRARAARLPTRRRWSARCALEENLCLRKLVPADRALVALASASGEPSRACAHWVIIIARKKLKRRYEPVLRRLPESRVPLGGSSLRKTSSIRL